MREPNPNPITAADVDAGGNTAAGAGAFVAGGRGLEAAQGWAWITEGTPSQEWRTVWTGRLFARSPRSRTTAVSPPRVKSTRDAHGYKKQNPTSKR